MPGAQVGISHNIGSVISDIDDVKDDLRYEMRKRVGAAMRVVWADAKQYVLTDPHTTGNLFSALQRDMDTTGEQLEFSVYTDASIAPYAAIVEFGTGRYDEWRGSKKAGPPTGDEMPPQYPFDTPSESQLPIIASYIKQWMIEKGIQPEKGSIQASSMAIASKIVDQGQYAHPYLRPAWFDNELQVKRAARNAVRNAVR